jgi:DNA mismatch repair protein MLH3
VSLLLANHQFSKLVLIDVERNKRMSVRLGNASMPEARISHDQREFDLKRIGVVLTQSGLVTPQNFDSWHEISASVSDLTVRGAISLQPSPSRKCQFISLGKEPLLSRNGSNVLYNEVNRLFASSDFSNVGAMSNRSSVPHLTSSVNQLDALSNASTRSWAKPVNKWPMFYVRIDTNAVIRLDDDDASEHLPESAKSVQRIVDVLGAMVHEFLKQHDLRPRNGRKQTMSSDQNQSIRSKASQPAGGSRAPLRHGRSISSAEEAFSGPLKIPSFPRSQSLNSGQSFNNWSRVKTAKDLKRRSPTDRTSGLSHATPDIMQGNSSLSILPKHKPNRRDDGQECTILPKPPGERVSSEDKEDLPGDSPSDKMITWVDPDTKLAYMINPRTGQTMNSRKSLATQRSPTDCVETPSKKPVQTYWIDNMLGAWDNPSFSRTEMPIPNLGGEAAGQQNTATSSHDCFKGIGSLDTAEVAKYRGKLQRRALETADVIAQVDRKFILAKVRTAPVIRNLEGPSNDVLLLIDQHAADERCRIEQLFTEMFVSAGLGENWESGARVRTVQVGSLAFEVSSTEGDLFQKYTSLFSTWGIEYVTQGKNNSTALITVHTLPVLIAERCRLEPHVLIDLMRREIWSSEEDGNKPFQSKRTFEQDIELSDSDDVVHQRFDSRSWVQRMNGCPQGIVDLLNSRACRTAIMFNDPLDIEECQALVSNLARCAFPFQCAHARPSMVPILDLRSFPESAVSLPLDLDTGASAYDDNYDMTLDFVEAFRTRYVT